MSMDSFIFIDGVILWVLLGLLLLIIFMFLAMGRGYINAIRENERLERQNGALKNEREQLKEGLSDLQQAYYKATFRVPEVDDVQV